MDRSALELIARSMMETAKALLMRHGSLTIAPLLIRGTAPNWSTIPLELDGHVNKEKLGAMLRLLAPYCEAIIVIDEAWMRVDEPLEEVVLPVRNDPKRKEGIFVSAQSKHGDWLLISTFERDGHNLPKEPKDAVSVWNSGQSFIAANFQNLYA